MPRTVTVKGVGHVSAKPDLIVISMTLENKNINYEKSVEISAGQIRELCSALEKVGFEKTDLKTVSFNVSTDYDNLNDGHGNYRREFSGYKCMHRLKLEFKMNVLLLAQVLSAISSCQANPELLINFTVKEPSEVSAELLKSAARNAREKAFILCESAGVKLGDLLNIDYSFSKTNLYSATRFDMQSSCPTARLSGIADMNFNPDDIDVSDTATFVWEII